MTRASPSASGATRTRTAAGRAPESPSAGSFHGSPSTRIGISAAGPSGITAGRSASRAAASAYLNGPWTPLVRPASAAVVGAAGIRQVQHGLATSAAGPRVAARARARAHGLALVGAATGVAPVTGPGHDGLALGREDERRAHRIGVDDHGLPGPEPALDQ